jgi:hypothetical protein
MNHPFTSLRWAFDFIQNYYPISNIVINISGNITENKGSFGSIMGLTRTDSTTSYQYTITTDTS